MKATRHISANRAYCGAQRTHLLVDRLQLGRLLGFLGRGAREEAHDFMTAEEGAATAHVASLGSPLNREEAHGGTKGRAIHGAPAFVVVGPTREVCVREGQS